MACQALTALLPCTRKPPPRSIYRDLNGGRAPPPAHRGLIGTCSAAVVLTLTLPLEVVRRRLQVQVRTTRCC